jgi:hypothetical protein
MGNAQWGHGFITGKHDTEDKQRVWDYQISIEKMDYVLLGLSDILNKTIQENREKKYGDEDHYDSEIGVLLQAMQMINYQKMRNKYLQKEDLDGRGIKT